MKQTPFRIGLTGGIGSGKSTACKIFTELGVTVLDADLISRELIQKGQPLLAEISSVFGQSILNKHGELDRDKMKTLIFNNIEKKKQLENILHPIIYQELLLRSQAVTHSYYLLAIPLLIETHGQGYVDRILLIDTTEEKQLLRASLRDHISPDSILNIIQQQATRQQRKTYADDVIHNNNDFNALRAQIEAIHSYYLALCQLNSKH